MASESIYSESGTDSRAADSRDGAERVEAGAETPARNDLKLVAEQARDQPAHGESSGERRGLPIWLFCLGILLFASLLGYQATVAGQLEAEVTRLQAELDRSQSQLNAHRAHLAEVRGSVHDLFSQFEGLRTLVDTAPAASASSAAASPDSPEPPAQP